jgi:hypothetical protein
VYSRNSAGSDNCKAGVVVSGLQERAEYHI